MRFSIVFFFRCCCLRSPSHDCLGVLLEDLASAPPTRNLLRLQSLGTEFGSDELGGCTSSEETCPSTVLRHDDGTNKKKRDRFQSHGNGNETFFLFFSPTRHSTSQTTLKTTGKTRRRRRRRRRWRPAASGV